MKCPECGREISNKAYACPGCGAPVQVDTAKGGSEASGTGRRRARAKWLLVPVVIVAVIVLAGAAVAAGYPPVEVPSLAGLTLPEAKALLAASGLTSGIVDERYSDSVACEELVEQSPAAGENVLRGSAVDIAFSAGPTPQWVPVVAGLAEGSARSALEALGFRVRVVRSYSSKRKGTVIAQSPADGRLQPGDAVEITVSKGRKTVWRSTRSSGSSIRIYSHPAPSLNPDPPAQFHSPSPVRPNFDALDPRVD